jgi:ADP-heptose:LPS heptosyltransferase
VRRTPVLVLAFIGLPWARELCERLAYIDDFIAFPGFPGLPEIEPQLERIPELFARARASRFDLIVQMHGSGALVNPIVVACGARACAGFYRAGEYCPRPTALYRMARTWHRNHSLSEAYRGAWLADAGRSDRLSAQRGRSAFRENPRAFARAAPLCVHPLRRPAAIARWPPERFARVAAELTARGYTIVFTGTASETELVTRVRSGIQSSRRASVGCFANVFDCSPAPRYGNSGR